MSLHSPYYISLTNLENLEKNIGYVLQSCAAAKTMGAGRIIVHTGSATGRDRSDALADAAQTLHIILGEMESAGYGELTLCPETMGKINQLGDFGEVMRLCAEEERLIPCIDFGHLYARSLGADEGYERTAQMLTQMESTIGAERTQVFHCHFSRIEYSKGGEKKHLTFKDTEFGPDFKPVALLLAERRLCPTIICESAGSQAEDALILKRTYFEALEKA
jgi:deoxyribonuclease-4